MTICTRYDIISVKFEKGGDKVQFTLTNNRFNDTIKVSYNKAVDGVPRKKNPDTVAKNTAYRNEYSKQHYDRLNLLLPKGTKKIIQDAAKAKGENISAYVINALEWYDDLDLSGKKKL